MKPLRVKGWTRRKRGTVEKWCKNDFTIGNYDFVWKNVADDEKMVFDRDLYVTGGEFGVKKELVNNPTQLIIAIANQTKVTVNYGRPGDSVNIFFSKKMVTNAKIIRYLDEDELEEEFVDDRSCADIEEAYDNVADVPED